MKIQKIINNNAVYGINEEKEEIIIMGPGIGYKKRAGDEIEQEKVDKIFCLKNQKSDKFDKLFKRVDAIYFDIALLISHKAEKLLQARISEQLIFALADHLFFSVSRYKEGTFTLNLMRHEIKILYPKEYEIGNYGRQIILEKLGIDLPKDEAGYIALHIVNSNLSEQSIDGCDLILLVNGITNIVKQQYGEVMSEDSFEYTRFITHIKYLSKRISGKAFYKSINMEEFMPQLLGRDDKLVNVIQKIAEFIQVQFNYEITNEDKVYLIMHILRVVK